MSSKLSIDDSCFASAPSSPIRSFHEDTNTNMCFYSVPNSPTKCLLQSICGSGSVTTSTMSTSAASTKIYNYEYFDMKEFEFETSRCFDIDVTEHCDLESSYQKFDVEVEDRRGEQKKYHRQHESLPTMAFADELFCDGKVMPLKPPPCQQFSFSNKSAYSNPPSPLRKNLPSPTNPNSLFKIPFAKRSLWNDDFDPFMVALESVKEEKKEGNHRRARSMIPLRACTQLQPEDLMDCKHAKCLHSSPMILSLNRYIEPNTSTSPTRMDPQKSLKSPIRLSEPKGVLFARRVRMVKMGTTISGQEPIIQAARLGGTKCPAENKWQKMKNLAFRSYSMRKTSDEKKQKDQNAQISRPKIFRKLTFKSKKMVHSNEEKKEIQSATKMTLTRYRPKLLLCMGYGGKFA